MRGINSLHCFLNVAILMTTVAQAQSVSGGGGNSGNSAELRGEVAPRLSMSWFTHIPIRAKNTPLKITVVKCSDAIREQFEYFFSHQLSPQLRCLSRAQEGWGRQASGILNHLLRVIPEIQIKCTLSGEMTQKGIPMSNEFSALSSLPSERNFPSVELNPGELLFAYRLEHKKLGPLFLHELLHWTGNLHFSSGPDLPYLSEMCCGVGEYDPQNPSCALLNQDPALWDTYASQKEFLSQLDRYGAPLYVQLNTVWNSYVRLMRLGTRESHAQANRMLELLIHLDPELAHFWSGLAGLLPKIPHPQGLIGLWLRSLLLEDPTLFAPYSKTPLQCEELDLSAQALKTFLNTAELYARGEDKRALKELVISCTH